MLFFRCIINDAKLMQHLFSPGNGSTTFNDCSKSNIWKQLVDKINCTIAPMKSIVPANSLVTECKDSYQGNITYRAFQEMFSYFTDSPDKYYCPVHCIQISYDIDLDYYYESTFIYSETDYSDIENINSFTLVVFYDTLNVKQLIESFDYDLGSFLASAGGNLGLFLGLSCLSILLSFIKLAKKGLS